MITATRTYLGTRCLGHGTRPNSCGQESRKLKICGMKNSKSVFEKCACIPTTANAIPARQQRVSPGKARAGYLGTFKPISQNEATDVPVMVLESSAYTYKWEHEVQHQQNVTFYFCDFHHFCDLCLKSQRSKRDVSRESRLSTISKESKILVLTRRQSRTNDGH